LRAFGYELQNFIKNKLFVFPALISKLRACGVRARIVSAPPSNLIMQSGERQQSL